MSIPKINPEKIQPAKGVNFVDKLRELYNKPRTAADVNTNDWYADGISANSSYDDILRNIINNKYRCDNTSVSKYSKFYNDMLNVDDENTEFSLYEYNGVEYVTIFIGGDAEVPVIMIIYFDVNGDLRAYVPFSGNYFNHDTRSSIGHDAVFCDDVEDIKFLMNNYPDLVAQAKGEDYSDEDDDFNEDDDWDDEDWLSDEDDEDEVGLPAWTDGLLDNAQCDEYACREEFENKCDEA